MKKKKEFSENFVEFVLSGLDPATLKTIEAVIKENPQFEDVPFIKLNKNKKFQQALREYALKNSIELSSPEVLKSVVPKKHTKPNNKLANTISKEPMIGEGTIELVVSSKQARNEVRTKVMLEFNKQYVELWGGWEQFTPYDREVYDGVVSLYAAGNTIINPAMVYRAMNGLTETEKVSPQALEAVRKSLDKSMHLYTILDYTAEARMYNKDIKKTTYEGYLFAASKAVVTINGEEHEAYKILDTPILYKYAQVSGQILTVPIKMLNTKNAVRSTEEVTVIRGYLLRQIGWMRDNNSTRSDHITYQGVYDELGVSRADLDDMAYRNKTRTIRNHATSILDEWKDQGYIIDYVEYKEGAAIQGVMIML